jgi:hypothetical protein
VEAKKCFTYVVPGIKNALQLSWLQSVEENFRDPAGGDEPFVQIF